jgi:hypothetical protein
MLEYVPIQTRNIFDGENSNKASHDGPEKELVTPNIANPLRDMVLRIGFHTEETLAAIHHLPG